jgi:hypothetical protein
MDVRVRSAVVARQQRAVAPQVEPGGLHACVRVRFEALGWRARHRRIGRRPMQLQRTQATRGRATGKGGGVKRKAQCATLRLAYRTDPLAASRVRYTDGCLKK